MKCTIKKHVFKDNERKCICGKADTWWYSCPRCKVSNVSKYWGIVCNDCEDSPEYKKELAQEKKNTKPNTTLAFRRFREPVAFVIDKKTGREMAMDKKGNKFDPGSTRYDLAHDKHGWKATNKIPKKRKYYFK